MDSPHIPVERPHTIGGVRRTPRPPTAPEAPLPTVAIHAAQDEEMISNSTQHQNPSMLSVQLNRLNVSSPVRSSNIPPEPRRSQPQQSVSSAVCIGCQGPHFLSYCKVFKGVSERTEVLNAKKKCLSCLQQKHDGLCRSLIFCHFCLMAGRKNRVHSSPLCPHTHPL